MNILIGIAFLGILGALAFAGVSMVRRDKRQGTPDGSAQADDGERPRDKRMAQALAWRVGISVALFLLILLSYHMGWIQPTGLPVAN